MAVLPLASRAVTVKFCGVPAVVGEGYPFTDNAVAEPATASVPFAVAVPAWQPAPLPAVTVNGYVPGCVRPLAGPVFLVVMVNVELASPPVLIRGLGLNPLVVVPTGAGDVNARLSGEVQELLFPLKFTVTV